MGIVADLYIADDENAAQYDKHSNRFAVDRAEWRYVTPLELSTLWALVHGRRWDVSMVDEFTCILQTDDGERLIHKIPSAMLTDLTALASGSLDTLAARWAETEELRHWSQSDTRELIQDLVKLARRATEIGRNLYLWNCV